LIIGIIWLGTVTEKDELIKLGCPVLFRYAVESDLNPPPFIVMAVDPALLKLWTGFRSEIVGGTLFNVNGRVLLWFPSVFFTYADQISAESPVKSNVYVNGVKVGIPLTIWVPLVILAVAPVKTPVPVKAIVLTPLFRPEFGEITESTGGGFTISNPFVNVKLFDGSGLLTTVTLYRLADRPARLNVHWI
jgi:hypothetical protein